MTGSLGQLLPVSLVEPDGLVVTAGGRYVRLIECERVPNTVTADPGALATIERAYANVCRAIPDHQGIVVYAQTDPVPMDEALEVDRELSAAAAAADRASGRDDLAAARELLLAATEQTVRTAAGAEQPAVAARWWVAVPYLPGLENPREQLRALAARSRGRTLWSAHREAAIDSARITSQIEAALRAAGIDTYRLDGTQTLALLWERLHPAAEEECELGSLGAACQVADDTTLARATAVRHRLLEACCEGAVCGIDAGEDPGWLRHADGTLEEILHLGSPPAHTDPSWLAHLLCCPLPATLAVHIRVGARAREQARQRRRWKRLRAAVLYKERRERIVGSDEHEALEEAALGRRSPRSLHPESRTGLSGKRSRRSRPQARRRPGARSSAASSRQLRPRPDAQAERGRQQRSPARYHREPHDSRTVGARHLRADHGQRRLRRPAADAPRHLRTGHPHPVRMGRERMVAAELTETAAIASDGSRVVRPRAGAHARRIAATYAALWALTALGTLIGRLLPTLAPGGRPHPTLHGSLADVAAIVATNARVLSAPFLLALFRFPSGRCSRRLGDLLVIGLLAGNALRVGLALGRDGDQLLPYLSQLPLEWLAAALVGGAWLTLRIGARTRTAIVYVAAVLALVGVAAAIETLATPRASPPRARVVLDQLAGRGTTSTGPKPDAGGRGGLPAPDRAPARALASRSLRSLSLAVARFRSAVWPALPGYVNHPRIPQRRDQE